ncbi:MAG: radical SAM protein [Nanoarchaeota archaeon]|nr:radical SAM protein [Nanoarchaeota archaeon]
MSQNKEIKIAVVNVVNKKKKFAMNKDLNGGFGTADSYANSIYERIISIIKRKSIKLPIISLAFLMGIFKHKNISANYYEGKLPKIEPDIILIYGSIVDYKNENFICELLKRKFKNAKIGFIGPFPSTKPKLFMSGDFIIIGDFEYFFLKKFKNKSQLKGNVIVKEKVKLDELPSPELDGFPIKEYSYSPIITKKPFFVLQSSRGCPYSCSYYCVYGKLQGSKVDIRSHKKIVGDIIYLKNKYDMKGFQFRDPTFGITKNYIEELCKEIKKNNLKIQWGIETRTDLLDKRKINLMFNAGLRNINIGIESTDTNIAKQNKRLLTNIHHQESLINYCEKLGIKISAFYLIGYEGDTKKSIKATLNYAIKLNTFLARFAVCTPYPGTLFFDDLEKQDRILTHDYEKYTQFNLIFKHDNLNNIEIQKMLSKAYKKYYFRPQYISKILKWKIREFWL